MLFSLEAQANSALRLVLLITTFSILTACATKKSLDEQSVIALNNNLAQLQEWELKGKIAWLTSKERKSAYINWQQNGDNMIFTLSSVLGINLATLTYDGTLAHLEADSNSYQHPSPSYLIYQATGWVVPIEQLSSWIKGAASNEGRLLNHNNASHESIQRFENGLIKQLKPQCDNCDEWQIDYNTYNDVNIDGKNYQLPTSVSLTNLQSQAVIKIRISEWSA